MEGRGDAPHIFIDQCVFSTLKRLRARFVPASSFAARSLSRVCGENGRAGAAGCAANAQTMLDAVNAFADAVPITNVDPGLLISKGLTLYDGTVAGGLELPPGGLVGEVRLEIEE